jgi:hypothetical protein
MEQGQKAAYKSKPGEIREDEEIWAGSKASMEIIETELGNRMAESNCRLLSADYSVVMSSLAIYVEHLSSRPV